MDRSTHLWDAFGHAVFDVVRGVGGEMRSTAARTMAGPRTYGMRRYGERQTITEVGGTPVQALIARLWETPGRRSWAGHPLDADGDAIRTGGWPSLADSR